MRKKTPTSAVNERKIIEMKNLGPACERDLHEAGIRNAQELIELGPEAAFLQMLMARKKNGRSTKCCNAAYLYALHGAIEDCDWRALSDSIKRKYKALTAELRASGKFR